jgi:SAM-dependent methyltransferase
MVRPEFPRATWTAFDRYARYGALARSVRSVLGGGEWKVLDVGDSSGYLGEFDAGLRAICLDVSMGADPLPGAVRVTGDGAALPFPDRSFDAVVSSDALEHVPPDRREAFLEELCRVARTVVAVAAPFDTAGVRGAEDLVRRYALLTLGREQDQLEEHLANGLPDRGAAAAVLRRAGLDVAVEGNGNLFDWLLLMLHKFQLEARPALAALMSGDDVFFNLALAGRNDRPPFYRHVIIGTRGAVPLRSPAPSHEENGLADTAALFAGLIAATNTEVSRQDVHGMVGRLELEVIGRLEPRLAALEAFLSPMGDWLHAANRNAMEHAQIAHREAMEQLVTIRMHVGAQYDQIGRDTIDLQSRVSDVEERITQLDGRMALVDARLQQLLQAVLTAPSRRVLRSVRRRARWLLKR